MSEAHVQKALGVLSSKRQIALQLQHYLPAAFALAQTDLVAVMPKTMSGFLKSFTNVGTFTPPFKVEPVVMRQFWHARSTRDAGCKWLRSQVLALFRKQ